MAYSNSTNYTDNSISHSEDAVPEFDLPRTRADRLVLALRYPADSDQPPITSVAKTIAGRVYRLAVYDADVLAGLLRMGWQDAARPPRDSSEGVRE